MRNTFYGLSERYLIFLIVHLPPTAELYFCVSTVKLLCLNTTDGVMPSPLHPFLVRGDTMVGEGGTPALISDLNSLRGS